MVFSSGLSTTQALLKLIVTYSFDFSYKASTFLAEAESEVALGSVLGVHLLFSIRTNQPEALIRFIN